MKQLFLLMVMGVLAGCNNRSGKDGPPVKEEPGGPGSRPDPAEPPPAFRAEDVRPPAAAPPKKKGDKLTEPALVVHQAADGAVLLAGRSYRSPAEAKAQLEKAFFAAGGRAGEEHPLVSVALRADRNASYERVYQVLRACAQIGYLELHLRVRTEDRPGAPEDQFVARLPAPVGAPTAKPPEPDLVPEEFDGPAPRIVLIARRDGRSAGDVAHLVLHTPVGVIETRPDNYQEALLKHLQGWKRSGGRNHVTIEPDPLLKYEHVIRLMEICEKEGVQARLGGPLHQRGERPDLTEEPKDSLPGLDPREIPDLPVGESAGAGVKSPGEDQLPQAPGIGSAIGTGPAGVVGTRVIKLDPERGTVTFDRGRPGSKDKPEELPAWRSVRIILPKGEARAKERVIDAGTVKERLEVARKELEGQYAVLTIKTWETDGKRYCVQIMLLPPKN